MAVFMFYMGVFSIGFGAVAGIAGIMEHFNFW
jgi:hypothetical protein